MRTRKYCLAFVASCLLTIAVFGHGNRVASAQGGTGSIEGHVTLRGRAPGNRVIRMGADPKCAQVNRGKLVIQEAVMATSDGSLAHVFVNLEGDFPSTPVPKEPVLIDQKDCIYLPRVVGVRLGQTVEISNSDDWLHNLHSSSRFDNGFNVDQPRAGLVYSFEPEDVEIMLRLGCDIHRWMTAYIGVLDHPYFSVTEETGTFEIADVPAGSYSIRAWHAVYGELNRRVRVTTGSRTVVDFTYDGE